MFYGVVLREIQSAVLWNQTIPVPRTWIKIAKQGQTCDEKGESVEEAVWSSLDERLTQTGRPAGLLG